MATSSPSSPSGDAAVPELLPLSAYQTVRGVFTPRVALVVALFWFIAMTLSQARTEWNRLGSFLVINAVAALVFGALFVIAMRWQMNRVTRRRAHGVQLDPRTSRGGRSPVRGTRRVGVHAAQEKSFRAFEPHPLGAARAFISVDRAGAFAMAQGGARRKFAGSIGRFPRGAPG